MADFAVKELGVTRVSILSSEDAWAEIISSAFGVQCRASGGEVESSESYGADETDFRTPITKLREKNIPAVYIPLLPQSRISFIKQARQLGYRGYILTGDLMQPEIDALGRMADGAFSTQVWSEDSQLREKYLQRFGSRLSEGALGFVEIGYSGARHVLSLLAEIKRAGRAANPLELQHAQISTRMNESKPRSIVVAVHDGRFHKLARH